MEDQQPGPSPPWDENNADPGTHASGKPPAGCLPYALAVLGVSAGVGVLAASIGEDPDLMVLLGNLVTAALAAAWVWYDAKWRGVPRPRLYAVGTFLLAFVFFPVYLFKSRGRRAWPLVAAGAGLFLLTLLVSEGLYWAIAGPPESALPSEPLEPAAP